MANIPGISAIKKTDKINYFQFTFQGSQNTANKKRDKTSYRKKLQNLKKTISDRIQSF